MQKHGIDKIESDKNQTNEWNFSTDRKKQKHNKHQHNTDEGEQAMGEDINITQMMVGKQWVKNWSMYRWAGEASIQVKEASTNNGYEAENNKAFWYNISLQKQVAWAENNVYTYRLSFNFFQFLGVQVWSDIIGSFFLVAFNVLTSIAVCHLPLHQCIATTFRIVVLSISFIVPSVVQCYLAQWLNILSITQPMMRLQRGIMFHIALKPLRNLLLGKKSCLLVYCFFQ